MPDTPATTQNPGADEAAFSDLAGNSFTITLPYSKLKKLRRTLGVDFRPADLWNELQRVLGDDELLYNVVSWLVQDQLSELGIERGALTDEDDDTADDAEYWFDLMFGERPDGTSPLQEAGAALADVVLGFIRNPRERQSARKQLAFMRSASAAVFEQQSSDVETLDPEEIGRAILEKARGEMSLRDAIMAKADEVLRKSTSSSNEPCGNSPEPQDSPAPTTTP